MCARVVLVALKYRHSRGNFKALQNALLKVISEDLTVSVHEELASDGVENHTPAGPLLIFGIAHNFSQATRRTPGSPAFPNVEVAMWTGEKLSVFLSLGQRATMCREENFSGIVPHEPVRADIAFLWTIPRSRRTHLVHYRLKRSLLPFI